MHVPKLTNNAFSNGMDRFGYDRLQLVKYKI
jgi:hypothetical protein